MAFLNSRIYFLLVLYSLVPDISSNEIPQNVVVLAGTDKVLSCAGGLPYRWYRYLPTNPSDDKVIYMGSRMADDVEARFRVYTSPEKYPFERLDLVVTDIQANHSGTYKCLQPQKAYCAEVIVLESQPKCRILRHTDPESRDTVDLRCDVDVTANGKPDMLCNHNHDSTLTETSCSQRADKMFTCVTTVPASQQSEYSCVIKISKNPLRLFKTCEQAQNEPNYVFTWQTSIDGAELNNYASEKFLLMIGLIVLSVAVVITSTCALVLCVRQTKKCKGYGGCKRSLKTPETPPPEYTSTSENPFEMPSSPPEYESLNRIPASEEV